MAARGRLVETFTIGVQARVRPVGTSPAFALGMRIVAIASLLLTCSCASAIPSPARAEQPEDAFVPVPYPPPPARPEQVPDAPAPEALWIDGEWRWRGGRWAWVYGRWVAPRADARYARWQTRRAGDGQLMYAAGRWIGDDDETLPPAPRYEVADADGGDRVEDVGIMVDVGANREAGRDGGRDVDTAEPCRLGCRFDDEPSSSAP